jgi:hypothetical protein
VRRALKAGKKIPDDLDFQIEDLVMKAYQIPEEHRTHIWDELKKSSEAPHNKRNIRGRR